MTSKGSKEVRIRSSGAEKKKLTVALTCTGDGKMLPALAIFKGKRKLKFKCPENVSAVIQSKGWMDSDLMLRWFKGVVVPYTKGRKALLVIDSFSAHETGEFLEEARANNVDVLIIPVVAQVKFSHLTYVSTNHSKVPSGVNGWNILNHL